MPVRPTKAQSNLQEGEEEWAELMRKSHGPKGADWYAKGMKTVEVSREAVARESSYIERSS